jgi:hypothetical protein
MIKAVQDTLNFSPGSRLHPPRLDQIVQGGRNTLAFFTKIFVLLFLSGNRGGKFRKKRNFNRLIVCFTASWGQRARLPKALIRTIEVNSRKLSESIAAI